MGELINLPKGHYILQSSSVQMQLQKAKFRIHKIYDSNNDSDYMLAFDSKNKEIDFNAIAKKETLLYSKKYGKLHPVLYNLVNSTTGLKNIAVAVWIKTSVTEPKKSTIKESELSNDVMPKVISEARARIVEQTSAISKEILKQTGAKLIRQSNSAPMFIINVNPAQLTLISQMSEVVALMHHDPKGINDLQDSLDISEGQQVVYVDGNRGNNIRVAVWEGGPDDESKLVIEGKFTSSPSTSSHARLTSGIIKNKESGKPHGYAPDCKLFSANSNDTDALEWAVNDKACRVISQSFHRSSEQTDGNLSSDDVLKDYLIMNYPYPTIMQAAGNIVTSDGDTTNEFVNHKGYNSMAIGNHNDDATAMSGDTTFRNPNSNHGDRELPELCANGSGVSAVGLTMSGTSFSAPAAAGSAAVLMGMNSTLKSWPEGIRALFLAGATINVRGNNWRSDMINGTDAKDGAGALNLQESAEITRNKKSPDNTPSRRGWDVGTLESSDFRSNGFCKSIYKIKVPKSGATHVKVALTWDSNAYNILWFKFSSLELDLDLRIYKGSTLVAQSSSWDNSCEIAEYDAKPGDELTIKIKRYSGNHWTYYGLAWNIF